MKCRCNKQSTVKLSYTQREYCDKCFLHYIEQRVRKDIRKKPIKPRDTVKLFDDDSKEFFVAKELLKRIFGDNITIKSSKVRQKNTVIPTNLDREVSDNLRNFLHNTNKESHMKLLDNLLEEEIVIICRILGRKAEATEKTHFLIEKMQEKYPDTKFSLQRSFQRL
ncbi:hypothetical protein ACFL1B_04685 [Nanoarchaeota archaeon]